MEPCFCCSIMACSGREDATITHQWVRHAKISG
jgi:hypothetical protein